MEPSLDKGFDTAAADFYDAKAVEVLGSGTATDSSNRLDEIYRDLTTGALVFVGNGAAAKAANKLQEPHGPIGAVVNCCTMKNASYPGIEYFDFDIGGFNKQLHSSSVTGAVKGMTGRSAGVAAKPKHGHRSKGSSGAEVAAVEKDGGTDNCKSDPVLAFFQPLFTFVDSS